VVETVPMTEAVTSVGLRNPDADNGLFPFLVSLQDLRFASGAAIPVTGSPTVLFWQADGLLVEQTSDDATPNNQSYYIEIVLPQNYIAGTDLEMSGVSYIYEEGGASTAHRFGMSVKRVVPTGGYGASLGSINELAVTTTPTAYTGTIDGATLSPGDVLALFPSLNVTAAAGGSGYATIRLQSLQLS
jgi:hypothetical protein